MTDERTGVYSNRFFFCLKKFHFQVVLLTKAAGKVMYNQPLPDLKILKMDGIDSKKKDAAAGKNDVASEKE